MRDPYEVLGVDRKASAGEIKSAFRRLAKKLHPDANKNDPKAATRFAELNAAHEILGEDDKRKAFDRGEIDAEGKPRFRAFGGGAGARPGGGFGPEGNFESFNFGPEGFTRATRGGRRRRRLWRLRGHSAGGFRRRRAPRGGRPRRSGVRARGFRRRRRCQAALTVSLPEAAHGVTQRLRLPTGKDVDVKIPAGIANGQQIRLQGPGHARTGRRRRRADHRLDRAAPDLHARRRRPAARTADHALRGGARRQGAGADARRPVEITIPAWTSSGRTFRLKGKGFPAKAGRGDLLATVRIVLPEQSDPELEALMKKWRADKPYDPRKDM